MKKWYYSKDDMFEVVRMIHDNPGIKSSRLQTMCLAKGVLKGSESNKSIRWYYLKNTLLSILGYGALEINGKRYATVKLNISLQDAYNRINMYKEHSSKSYPQTSFIEDTYVSSLRSILQFIESTEYKSLDDLKLVCAQIQSIQNGNLMEYVIDTYKRTNNNKIEEFCKHIIK